MTDDREKSKKEGRVEKTKGRLQPSFPEIQRLVRSSNAVDIAQSIFRQFADDIQLKDLLAKAEALVANTNLGLAKTAPKDAPRTVTLRNETPSDESARKAPVRKTPAKAARPKKAAPKKTLSKKKKPAPKRKAKTRG